MKDTIENEYDDETEQRAQERRKHKRFIVLEELHLPVTLQIQDAMEPVHGVLLDLSAIGIGLILFTAIPTGAKVKLSLALDKITAKKLEGEVIWSQQYKDACRLGIRFRKVDKKFAADIGQIADDYLDCDLQIALGIDDICYPDCKYYPFCRKSIKV